VVVGVGESGSSSAALAWSLDLCRRRGWLLDVVTAWPDVAQVPVHEVPGHYCLPLGDGRSRRAGYERVSDSCRVRSSCPVVVVDHTVGGSATRGRPPAATGSP
jgi:hypothetical protein